MNYQFKKPSTLTGGNVQIYLEVGTGSTLGTGPNRAAVFCMVALGLN